MGTNDPRIHDLIEELVAEEHRLLESGEGEGLDEAAEARLREVQIDLDRLWDLLRQRRARRRAGLDPDEASLRGEGVVEDYEQ